MKGVWGSGGLTAPATAFILHPSSFIFSARDDGDLAGVADVDDDAVVLVLVDLAGDLLGLGAELVLAGLAHLDLEGVGVLGVLGLAAALAGLGRLAGDHGDVAG